jgi:hypothetical protein
MRWPEASRLKVMFLDIPLSVTLSDVRPNIAFASAPLKYPDTPVELLQSTSVQYLLATLAVSLLFFEHEKTNEMNTAAITTFLGKGEKCLINVFIYFILFYLVVFSKESSGNILFWKCM